MVDHSEQTCCIDIANYLTYHYLLLFIHLLLFKRPFIYCVMNMMHMCDSNKFTHWKRDAVATILLESIVLSQEKLPIYTVSDNALSCTV